MLQPAKHKTLASLCSRVLFADGKRIVGVVVGRIEFDIAEVLRVLSCFLQIPEKCLFQPVSGVVRTEIDHMAKV